MPPTSSDDGGNPARQGHYSKIKTEIDEKVVELDQEGYKKLQFTPPEIAAEADVNYNTAHKNGVFHKLKSNFDALEYQTWKGITIDIEAWIEENELDEDDKDE